MLGLAACDIQTRLPITDVDDVKPSISSMNEFTIVDQGSALFEGASGCSLHRDPTSGKVKFLALGRWRGTLEKEDLPVNYIVMSEHLDMIGVKLLSTFQKTRKVNGDDLQSRVKNVVGPWRGGKFMPLNNRPHSINNYCFSKVWFKCSTLNIRLCDKSKILSNVKQWLFADQLEKPKECVLYRPRNMGGLGLVHLDCKALSFLITTFLETAGNARFKCNLYHQALLQWHVDEVRNIPPPPKSPYYDDDFFASIRKVKTESSMNIFTMSSRTWYRVLMEDRVTHSGQGSQRSYTPCRAEVNNPAVDWERSWNLAATPGLSSDHSTFLWRMLHNLLPTQERLYRMGMPNITSDICSHCDLDVIGNLDHSLLNCPFNDGAGQYLVAKLSVIIHRLKAEQITLLNIEVEECDKLPATFLIATVLSEAWQLRKEKRRGNMNLVRASLEAGVNIMRKGRQ